MWLGKDVRRGQKYMVGGEGERRTVCKRVCYACHMSYDSDVWWTCDKSDE
jgi:hypothetical protein